MTDPTMSKYINRTDYLEALVAHLRTELEQSHDTEVRLSSELGPLLVRTQEWEAQLLATDAMLTEARERIAELETASCRSARRN